MQSIVDEAATLVAKGYKEVTLLGQNVNSYRDGEHDFADLMQSVAGIDRGLRVRFTTSHPQDMSMKLIETIAGTENICKYIHLPIQSASGRILELMGRGYSIEHYRSLIGEIRRTIPGVSLTTDIISGFPTETEDDHRMTLSFMRELRYDGAYTFKYSPREHTKAWDMQDDVPDAVKGKRVLEIAEMQQGICLELNRQLIGTMVTVLVEGSSKKSVDDLTGRTDTNRTVVFPKGDESPGQYVDVMIDHVNSATLFGRRIRSNGEGHA